MKVGGSRRLNVNGADINVRIASYMEPYVRLEIIDVKYRKLFPKEEIQVLNGKPYWETTIEKMERLIPRRD